MKDYKKHYKNLDTLKIVSILRNPTDYNKDAISEATEELKRRNISESSLKEIYHILEEIDENIRAKSKRTVELKKYTKEIIKEGIEVANPKISSSDSIKIKSFSSLLIANSICALISQWNFFEFVFTDEMSRGIGFFEISLILLIILSCFAGIAFWNRMKIGYYLAFTISTIGTLTYLAMIISLFQNNYMSITEKIPDFIFDITAISILIYAIKFLLQKNIRKLYLET